MTDPEVEEETLTIGTLTEVGARWELRFERVLPYSPERIWQAVTEPEHLANWFPQNVSGEFTVGATLTFGSALPGVNDFTGVVSVAEAPHRVGFTWGPADEIAIEITPQDRGTLLTFVDSITELGKAARDAAGWHTCLDELEAELSGAPPNWSSVERWQSVHPSYVARFGREASRIGPPTSTD